MVKKQPENQSKKSAIKVSHIRCKKNASVTQKIPKEHVQNLTQNCQKRTKKFGGAERP